MKREFSKCFVDSFSKGLYFRQNAKQIDLVYLANIDRI